MTATKTTLTLKIVNHNKVNKTYAVWELQQNGDLKKLSKDYTHSTSAFAALGRLYQKEVQQNSK